ncbi:MAG: hypothetical protein SNH79_07350 [Rikenellaceae bacterium]
MKNLSVIIPVGIFAVIGLVYSVYAIRCFVRNAIVILKEFRAFVNGRQQIPVKTVESRVVQGEPPPKELPSLASDAEPALVESVEMESTSTNESQDESSLEEADKFEGLDSNIEEYSASESVIMSEISEVCATIGKGESTLEEDVMVVDTLSKMGGTVLLDDIAKTHTVRLRTIMLRVRNDSDEIKNKSFDKAKYIR